MRSHRDEVAFCFFKMFQPAVSNFQFAKFPFKFLNQANALFVKVMFSLAANRFLFMTLDNVPGNFVNQFIKINGLVEVTIATNGFSPLRIISIGAGGDGQDRHRF